MLTYACKGAYEGAEKNDEVKGELDLRSFDTLQEFASVSWVQTSHFRFTGCTGGLNDGTRTLAR